MLLKDPRQTAIATAKEAHDVWLIKMGINPKAPPRPTKSGAKNAKPGTHALPNLKVKVGRDPNLPNLNNSVPANGTKTAKVM